MASPTDSSLSTLAERSEVTGPCGMPGLEPVLELV